MCINRDKASITTKNRAFGLFRPPWSGFGPRLICKSAGLAEVCSLIGFTPYRFRCNSLYEYDRYANMINLLLAKLKLYSFCRIEYDSLSINHIQGVLLMDTFWITLLGTGPKKPNRSKLNNFLPTFKKCSEGSKTSNKHLNQTFAFESLQ